MLSTEEYLSLFNPVGLRRTKYVMENNLDLVHYTSASNALRILGNQEVTLRNATLMNDFSEIDHGEKCVLNGWQSKYGRGPNSIPTGKLFELLNELSPTIFPAVEQSYDRHLQQRKTNTFLLSLAEHNELVEGSFGKLSMWRAYGGRTNVALIVNAFVDVDDDETGLFTAPVTYSHQLDFGEEYFRPLVDTIEANMETLREMDRDHIVHYLSWTLNSLALSTKHPGFSEEREWRIIYAPWLQPDSKLKEKVLDIQGVPQKCFLIDISSEANARTPHRSISQILKKIIIGPTEHPWVLYEAFVNRLSELGISDAQNRVVVSDIPIRR